MEIRTTLGQYLQAARLGWRELPGEFVWFRLMKCDEEGLFACELCPHGESLPRERGGKGTHIVWWAEAGDERGREHQPTMQKLLDGFFVYHAMKPITTYTRFLLAVDPETDSAPLVEGSVSHEYDPEWMVDLQRAIVARVKNRPVKVADSPLSLRFRILQRDSFRCRYCGRTAEETRLQVDHVVPRSKGGVTREENLVTACWECNIGKSDVLLPESTQTPSLA